LVLSAAVMDCLSWGTGLRFRLCLFGFSIFSEQISNVMGVV
jgi:hypothetical protein